ncbi:protein NO VEIN domain-containing protein [Cellulophaga sp. Z1A5H]|uniref:protein NO VEIN domain-containing protein n=1 Tax=Cellulophaga sp. Z1A5H TaxID=2687291 RepID=UPI0013FD2526|nr:DUF3883 domain-containing protein [Cellulophaga sp. Z1A5H]
METHFEILIDASGSMGYMRGSKEYEYKYLLPDKSTRTSLAKKIINESFLDQLSFADFINISTFRVSIKLDPKGEKIIKSKVVVDNNGKKVNQRYHEYFNDLKPLFKGVYDKDLIKQTINKILDPEIGGTPLCWTLSESIHKITNKTNILVLSDGDANDKENFDDEIIELLKEKNKDCTIYFIGIDQDDIAQKKSKRLAEFTNGKYINVAAINYDKDLFDNFLFDIKTTITQEAISAAVQQNVSIFEPQQPQSNIINPKQVVEQLQHEPIIEGIKIETDEKYDSDVVSEKNNEKSESKVLDGKLEQEVANNSKSLSLISDQLKTLTGQVSYLKKAITSSDKDEFYNSDEDEEVNKITGQHCERLLFEKFKTKSWQNLDWLNEKDEQFKSYDFTAMNKEETIYIECKGTRSNSNEFALTKAEWLFYLSNKPNYELYFVRSIIGKEVEIIRFEDLLQSIEKQELLPFSAVNRKVKADRIWFQINKNELWI